MSQTRQTGVFHEPGKLPETRLTVGYFESGAKKAGYNGDKGVKQVQKAYGTGQITKENINKRGYNRFLEISKNIKAVINRDKITDDEHRDGFKGCLTDTDPDAKAVYEQYSGLRQVENAFRVTKGRMELRPVFHFTPKRIEAHVCICFVAYKICRELARVLKCSGITVSVDKVPGITETVTTVKIRLPAGNQSLSKTMLLTSKHKSIACLFDENFRQSV